MAAKGKSNAETTKVKAQETDVSQLVITAAYVKVFKSGKTGFFGKAMNPANGDKYQIVGAVKIG
jgi:acyl-CoA thioesterase FadM